MACEEVRLPPGWILRAAPLSRVANNAASHRGLDAVLKTSRGRVGWDPCQLKAGSIPVSRILSFLPCRHPGKTGPRRAESRYQRASLCVTTIPQKNIGTLRFWQVFVKPSTASHCGKRCRSGRNSGTMPAGANLPRNETAYLAARRWVEQPASTPRPAYCKGRVPRRDRTRWQCGSQLRMTAGTDRPRGTAHMPRPDGVGVGLGEIAPSRRVK